MLDLELTKKRLYVEEDCSLEPYACSAGYMTVGVGWNLDKHEIPKHISERHAWCGSYPLPSGMVADMLDYQLNEGFLPALNKLPWYESLDPARKHVIVDMAFNMGVRGVEGFTWMVVAMAARDWNEAAIQILDSAYGRGATRNRAWRNALIMRSASFECLEGYCI